MKKFQPLRRDKLLFPIIFFILLLSVPMVLIYTPAILSKPVPHYPISSKTPLLNESNAYNYTFEISTQYKNREVCTTNNSLSASWFFSKLTGFGLQTFYQNFTVTLYSKPCKLINVFAIYPGKTDKFIIISAQRDIAPTAEEGANNDGSGMGTLVELARVLRKVELNHTLIFLSVDAEEYGMLGARYFADNIENTDNFKNKNNVIAFISLNNMGEMWGEGIELAGIGQQRGYIPLWFLSLIVDCANSLNVKTWFADSVLQYFERSVQVSLTDQGPFNRVDIPGVTFNAYISDPAKKVYLDKETYHLPGDNMSRISPFVLGFIGRTAELVVYSLDMLTERPSSSEPYVYLEPDKYMDASAIYFVCFYPFVPLLFYLVYMGYTLRKELNLRAILREVLLIILSALPLIFALTVSIPLQKTGVMTQFELYPPPPKAPYLYSVEIVPLAIIILTALLTAIFFYLIWKKYLSKKLDTKMAFHSTKFTILLTFFFILFITYIVNPYAALVYLLPGSITLLFIKEPYRWYWKIFNLSMVILSGVTLYILIPQYAEFLEISWTMLWYLIIIISTGLLPFISVILFSLVFGIVVRCGKIGILQKI